MHIEVSHLLTIIGWTITLFLCLTGGNIGLFLWQSKRELTKNDEHKKEMELQQEKFMLLHIQVINGKIEALRNVVDKNEAKSEAADSELKELYDKSNRNEYTLFKQDEHARTEFFDHLANVKTDLAKVEANLGHNRRSNDK